MCPCEFSVPTNAHVRLDYACEVLYVILTLNYIKLINIVGNCDTEYRLETSGQII